MTKVDITLPIPASGEPLVIIQDPQNVFLSLFRLEDINRVCGGSKVDAHRLHSIGHSAISGGRLGKHRKDYFE